MKKQFNYSRPTKTLKIAAEFESVFIQIDTQYFKLIKLHISFYFLHIS